MNFLAGALLIIGMAVLSFLISIPLLFVAAIFVKLAWNAVVSYLDLPNTITYFQATSLCFYFYVIKMLFGIEIKASSK